MRSEEIDFVASLARYFPEAGTRLKAQGRPKAGATSAPDLRVGALDLAVEVKFCRPLANGVARADYKWPGSEGAGIRKDFDWLGEKPSPGETKACVLFLPTEWVWDLNQCIGLSNYGTQLGPFEFAELADPQAFEKPGAHRRLTYPEVIDGRYDGMVDDNDFACHVVGSPKATGNAGRGQAEIVWAAVYTSEGGDVDLDT